MKHIFILNPKAGRGNSPEMLEQILAKEDVDWEVYVTKGPKDATRYIRERSQSGEELRFYACGGDGTLNEVAQGVIGFDNVSMSCYPIGSGNDFVKCFGKEKFMDPVKLCHAPHSPIDAISVDDKYCINACHFGFDSAVAMVVNRLRSKKIIGGKLAYIVGVLRSLVKNMKTKGELYVDGERIGDGEFLLCTITNGQYVGGMFKCAPRASYNDGYLEFGYVKPVSRLTFIKLVKYYMNGVHLDHPKFQNLIEYRRCREVEFRAEDSIPVSLDGEIVDTNHFVVKILPGAIKFAVPSQEQMTD